MSQEITKQAKLKIEVVVDIEYIDEESKNRAFHMASHEIMKLPPIYGVDYEIHNFMVSQLSSVTSKNIASPVNCKHFEECQGRNICHLSFKLKKCEGVCDKYKEND